MVGWIRLSPSRWALLAAIGLPLAELAVFVGLVLKIGLLGTLALMLATTALGIFLLRRAGRGQIAQIRVGPNGIAGATGGSGVFLALGGILLVLPGFLTDALGLLLLLRPVQRGLGAALARMLKPSGERDGVLDLAPDEWRETGSPAPSGELPPPDPALPPDQPVPRHERPQP